MLARQLPASVGCKLHVLHINHMLRGAQANEDEAFVVRRCAELGVACTVRRIDVASRAAQSKDGLEAVARAVRYEAAHELLDCLCAESEVDPACGIVCTAHTLDDRVETFYMRTLVGTGPGGLASIPRARGRLRRPLLDGGVRLA